MAFFELFFDELFPTLLSVGAWLIDFFTSSIAVVISSEFGITLPDWISSLPLLSYSILDLSIGLGLPVFIGYTLVKWITDIAA